MYIINLTYTGSLQQVDAHLAAHRAWLDQQYARSLFLASGPQTPRTGGIIIARAMPRPQLEALLKEDPFAQANMARYEIIEFTPVKQHPALAVTGLLDTAIQS